MSPKVEMSKVQEMRIHVALEGLKSAALHYDDHKPESMVRLQTAALLYKRTVAAAKAK